MYVNVLRKSTIERSGLMEHVLLVPLLELVNSILGIFKLLVVVYVVLSYWLL